MKASKMFAAVCSAVFLAFFAAGCKGPAKVSVVFYGLDEPYRNAICSKLESFAGKNGRAYEFSWTVADESEPLASQIEGHDVAFTFMGLGAEHAAELAETRSKGKAGIESSVMAVSSVSLRNKAQKNEAGKICVLPLLMDNNEIYLDQPMLNRTETAQIHSWTDVEEFARRAEQFVEAPMVFAGRDCDTVLGIAGALTEALSGKEAYGELVNRIAAFFDSHGEYTDGEIESLLEELTAGADSPLYSAAYILSRWNSLGYIHSEAFRMSISDVKFFMENKNTAAVFMPLSVWRTMSSRNLNRFASIPRVLSNNGNSAGFYPSVRSADDRYINSAIVCAVPLAKNAAMENAVSMLLSESAQEDLSLATGLSPVHSQCRVADIQADDVRFWAAATGTPLTPLGDAAFEKKSDREAFAKVLTRYLSSR